MANFEYNPIAESIRLRFQCPECGEYIETDSIYPPNPDFTAETHHDSIQSDVYEQLCDNCGASIDIELSTGFYGGDGYISSLDEEATVEVEEYSPDDDYHIHEYIIAEQVDSYLGEVLYTLEKIDCLDEISQKLLYRTLYANIISCLEAYLCDRLLQVVLSTNESKRTFVENFKDFSVLKINLSDIYKNAEVIDKTIIKALREVIYHNLGRVKNIYSETVDVDLGDIKELSKAISKRHDIVHRNGKDKEGNLLLLNKNEVINLGNEVQRLIAHIETQLI